MFAQTTPNMRPNSPTGSTPLQPLDALPFPQIPPKSGIPSTRDASLMPPWRIPIVRCSPGERARSACGGCRLVPRRGSGARVPSAAKQPAPHSRGFPLFKSSTASRSSSIVLNELLNTSSSADFRQLPIRTQTSCTRCGSNSARSAKSASLEIMTNPC